MPERISTAQNFQGSGRSAGYSHDPMAGMRMFNQALADINATLRMQMSLKHEKELLDYKARLEKAMEDWRFSEGGPYEAQSRIDEARQKAIISEQTKANLKLAEKQGEQTRLSQNNAAQINETAAQNAAYRASPTGQMDTELNAAGYDPGGMDHAAKIAAYQKLTTAHTEAKIGAEDAAIREMRQNAARRKLEYDVHVTNAVNTMNNALKAGIDKAKQVDAIPIYEAINKSYEVANKKMQQASNLLNQAWIPAAGNAGDFVRRINQVGVGEKIEDTPFQMTLDEQGNPGEPTKPRINERLEDKMNVNMSEAEYLFIERQVLDHLIPTRGTDENHPQRLLFTLAMRDANGMQNIGGTTKQYEQLVKNVEGAFGGTMPNGDAFELVGAQVSGLYSGLASNQRPSLIDPDNVRGDANQQMATDQISQFGDVAIRNPKMDRFIRQTLRNTSEHIFRMDSPRAIEYGAARQLKQNLDYVLTENFGASDPEILKEFVKFNRVETAGNLLIQKKWLEMEGKELDPQTQAVLDQNLEEVKTDLPQLHQQLVDATNGPEVAAAIETIGMSEIVENFRNARPSFNQAMEQLAPLNINAAQAKEAMNYQLQNPNATPDDIVQHVEDYTRMIATELDDTTAGFLQRTGYGTDVPHQMIEEALGYNKTEFLRNQQDLQQWQSDYKSARASGMRNNEGGATPTDWEGMRGDADRKDLPFNQTGLGRGIENATQLSTPPTDPTAEQPTQPAGQASASPYGPTRTRASEGLVGSAYAAASFGEPPVKLPPLPDLASGGNGLFVNYANTIVETANTPNPTREGLEQVAANAPKRTGGGAAPPPIPMPNVPDMTTTRGRGGPSGPPTSPPQLATAGGPPNTPPTPGQGDAMAQAFNQGGPSAGPPRIGNWMS
jgi:hypothetical protein